MIKEGKEEIIGFLIDENGEKEDITLRLEGVSEEEREVILAGCLINYYNKKLT